MGRKSELDRSLLLLNCYGFKREKTRKHRKELDSPESAEVG
jgi:hypothetical protein